MLNLVYAASVIETPSRITRPGVEIRGAPLKVRSETQYLQAYLSLSAPYTPPFLSAGFVSTLVQHHRRLCYHHGLLFISELKARIIQAVLAALARLVREISFVLNPRHRHIKLRNEKILPVLRQRFSSLHFSPVLRIFIVIILGRWWIVRDSIF